MGTENAYAIIGAGPSGLAAAKNLAAENIPYVGFELNSGVGGLWDINAPRSTMYESAHLISSARMTEFVDFPMRDGVADYPHHTEMKRYFDEVAEHFGISDNYRFDTEVTKLAPEGDKWRVTSVKDGQQTSELFAGVLIANGTLSEPNKPQFKGDFTGDILHAAEYRHADLFKGKRVLVVGAGNSGCDIVVDAVHQAEYVDISVRRGYYFVPKYVFGKPADTVGGKIKLPMRLKQAIDSRLLKIFTGDPERLGFPKPDYKIYESHPIVNSLVLHHLGHGDLTVKPDIEKLSGNTVHFADGSQRDYDLILTATGYKLHYPFIDKAELNWQGDAPQLYLNCFHPKYHNLFMMGMIEASGLGWEGRNKQAKLVARFIRRVQDSSPSTEPLIKRKQAAYPDMRAGMRYLKLARMAYYVHKDTYLKQLEKELGRLK